MRARIILTTLAAGVLVLAGACGETTRGDARPMTETPGTASPTPSSPATGSLSEVDPCSLLTADDAGALGATAAPKRETVGTADTCAWKPTDANLSVGIRTNLGLAQTQSSGGQITDITVGDRQAKQVSGRASGGCLVVLGVTASSRVDVTVIPPPDGDGCPLALKVAGLVEPKLP
ncbi:DUF3558 family protein [Lentzea sp.]|uniref:DUF3558 family protein n=1 Tax=Lentzea sp. TaxID=56099 RepID=UPI002B5937BE|nr:DUF3558 family protein [Lentzea sp.]HUQ58415.1 DUF3558 family protein [Lentzea sp.]